MKAKSSNKNKNKQTNKQKKAYKLIKDLTNDKQGPSTAVQDKERTEENILNRWTEYCSEYDHWATRDRELLNVSPAANIGDYHILCEEVEAPVKALKVGMSPAVDNIAGELVQAGGETMANALTTIYKKLCVCLYRVDCWMKENSLVRKQNIPFTTGPICMTTARLI